jgi:hypothetical protein
MDLRRLRAGEWITAAAGVVLAVSLFLPWYTRPGTEGGELTAWEAFAILDVLLLALAILAVGLLILTAVQPTAAVGIAADALLTLVAAAILVLTLFRVLAPPGSLERAEAGWLGLAAGLAVLVGTVVAMRDERLSEKGRPTDATGVPVAAPPEIEPLPAPAPDDSR